MKLVIVTALVLGSSGAAFARDHQELVCAAVVDAKDGGEKVALFIHFFEHRDPDGQSRDETLSNIYQGRLFAVTRINKSGGYSTDAPIVLGTGKAIRFRGTYSVVDGANGYELKLTGKINEDPSAKKATFRDVAATLPCVDLSI